MTDIMQILREYSEIERQYDADTKRIESAIYSAFSQALMDVRFAHVQVSVGPIQGEGVVWLKVDIRWPPNSTPPREYESLMYAKLTQALNVPIEKQPEKPEYESDEDLFYIGYCVVVKVA